MEKLACLLLTMALAGGVFAGCSAASDQLSADQSFTPEESAQGEEGGSAASASNGSPAEPSQEEAGLTPIPEAAYIAPEEAYRLQSAGEATVVDVRSPRYYREVCAKDSLNMPVAMIEQRIREVPEGSMVLLMSSPDGDRLQQAYDAFLENGIAVDRMKVVEGGVEAWVAAGLPSDNNLKMAC